MSSFASSAAEESTNKKEKQEIKIVAPSTVSPWGTIGRTFVLSAVALFSKALLGMFNSTTVSNHETFLREVKREDRCLKEVSASDDKE